MSIEYNSLVVYGVPLSPKEQEDAMKFVGEDRYEDLRDTYGFIVNSWVDLTDIIFGIKLYECDREGSYVPLDKLAYALPKVDKVRDMFNLLVELGITKIPQCYLINQVF